MLIHVIDSIFQHVILRACSIGSQPVSSFAKIGTSRLHSASLTCQGHGMMALRAFGACQRIVARLACRPSLLTYMQRLQRLRQDLATGQSLVWPEQASYGGTTP